MRKPLLTGVLLLLSCLGLLAGNDYQYFVDLTDVHDDKLTIKLIPPDLKGDQAVFMIPAIIPGTYDIYDFGRFVSEFKVTAKDGKEIAFTKRDKNTFVISSPEQIAFITYDVEDTWDTQVKEKFVFEPGGTNIEQGKNFMLNNHGFFGYFKGLEAANFHLEIKKPIGFYASTGLTDVKSGMDKDEINVFDYHDLVDSPIMYCRPDTTFVEVGGARVLVSVYSPNKKVTSAFIAKNIDAVLNAQKDYLGGTLPVKKYAFLIYLIDHNTGSGATGALEHSYSSMYVIPEMDSTSMAQTMRDVAAHEFFHIVTPLNIHSEEIGNFDFNNPKMSEHLWLYEGLTEYAAHHVQVKYGLIDFDQFFEVIQEKMEEAQKFYNDSLSFTFMSKNVLDSAYHPQYQNVYAKGALIGMCLDIQLRYLSNGKYGTQELMRDLAKKYGKSKSFRDEDLFSDIEKLTYPEIRKFLDNCVRGNKKLPFEQVFEMVGLKFVAREEKQEISLGGFGLGFNPVSNRAVIYDAAEMNEFGKKMGYKEGDEIITFNGQALTLDNVKTIIYDYLTKTKPGEKLKVEVARKDKKGREKIKMLKAKVKPTKVVITNNITVAKEITARQLAARNAWLGLTGN
jgi:predicted metalloprotease with PDZ domain